MLIRYRRVPPGTRGFTLIELMIITAILGILVVVALPNFAAYRDKSNIAVGLRVGTAVRAALASYAADSPGNLYPLTIADYGALTTIVNIHGGQLKNTEQEMGVEFLHYNLVDADGNGDNESYAMSFVVSGVPRTQLGWCIVVAPEGVSKCEPE